MLLQAPVSSEAQQCFGQQKNSNNFFLRQKIETDTFILLF